MAPTPSLANKRALPSKESSLFKDLLNQYETRQLKKGQKTADQILKKFPDHGETLCMKGLLLTHMGKREEGLELVKKGMRLDLTSHICWHVFGLIQKGEKNYEEALKSYTQALRFDKDNLNLLQDAANLQAQLRLYDGLEETRHTILKLRPNIRRNWIGLAVACHLNGNLQEANRILEQYQLILKNIPDYDVEHSEVLLYHIRVLEELENLEDGLSLLDISAKSRTIVDRKAICEVRARLLTKLRKFDEAEHAWRALIEQNADCHGYYKGLLEVKGIDIDLVTDDKRHETVQILREITEQLPRANTPRRLLLDLAKGDEFQEFVKEYIIIGLVKGVPSLFADLKALYADLEKRQVIENFILQLKESSESTGSDDLGNPFGSPVTYLWILYFLSQHYSYLRRIPMAISILDIALKHTPTLPELYSCKGRALKRAGDLLGAARCLEDARKLDGQDRFVNAKSARYHLRAGLIDEAMDILSLFTRKDAASPSADLEDMQVVLYLIEEADAQNRLGRLGYALKRYLAVQKVFGEFANDQYDFHSYSIRRFTINMYLNLIEWEDGLRSHPALIKSAVRASEIYVRVHDDPSLIASSALSAALSSSEKRAQKKAKKAANKMQEEAKKASANSSSNEDKGLEPSPLKDEDPDGQKALAVSDPLEQAWKLLKPFLNQSIDSIELWIVIYDVSIRRSKYVQAARSLAKAHSIDENHPEVHFRLVDFAQKLRALPESMSDEIRSTIILVSNTFIPEEVSLDTFNSQYLQRNSTSAAAILASAKALRKLGAPLDEVEDTIFTIILETVHPDVKASYSALLYMKSLQSTRAEDFRKACDTHFELSTIFKSSEELHDLQVAEESTQTSTVDDVEK